MFTTGWNKPENQRTFLNYYIVAPFSNDQKAQENRFKYLAGSFGMAGAGFIIGFGPISLIYHVAVAALIMKEWYTTLPKDRFIQKISLDQTSNEEKSKKKIKELEESIVGLKGTISNLESQVGDAKNANPQDKTAEKIQNLENTINSLKTQHRNEVNALNNRHQQNVFNALNNQEKEFKEAKIADSKTSLDREDILQLKIKELENELEIIKLDLESTKKANENDTSKLKKQIDDLNEKIKALKQEHSEALDKKTTMHAEETKALNAEIEKLKSLVEKAKPDNESANYKSELENLQNKLNELADNNKMICAEKEKQAQEHENANSENQKKIEELQFQLRSQKIIMDGNDNRSKKQAEKDKIEIEILKQEIVNLRNIN